jgi:hypothetical protein
MGGCETEAVLLVAGSRADEPGLTDGRVPMQGPALAVSVLLRL